MAAQIVGNQVAGRNNQAGEAFVSAERSRFDRLASGGGKRRHFLSLVFGATLAGMGALMACSDIPSGPAVTATALPTVRTAGLDDGAFASPASGSPCVTSVSPGRASFTNAGGTGSFTVNAPAGCAWDVENACPTWIRITSGATGTGPGTVTYAVRANATGVQRQCQLGLSGGINHRVSEGA
jgi:hypothetical protein